MHVDKPKDQDQAGHAITKLHLTSSLTFLKTNIQKTSLFPQINTKSEFSPPTLLSFLLRKELGSSLKSFSQVHGFTHQQKDQTHLISYSHFLKETRRLKKLSSSLMPTGPTPKRKKTLSSSLPLILLGLATRKGKSFRASEILFLFSPQKP